MKSGAVDAVLVIIAYGVAFKGSTAESRPPRVERVQAHYGPP
jgi:hypothetical protein